MQRRFWIAALLAIAVLGLINWDSVQDGTSEPQFVLSAPPAAASSAPAASTSTTADDTLSATVFPVRTVTPYLPYPAYVYVPTKAASRQPLQAVFAIHGMGGEGKGFAAALVKEADQHGWLLVAPTINYGDWHNPEQVAQEDIEITQRLLATFNNLPQQTGFSLKPRIDLYGFSRGAQVAHRFALFFPEHADRVAAFSAGTYTLPYKTLDVQGDGQRANVVLPYGVGDLGKRLGKPINPARVKQVRFFIGVGGADNSANDVPRQWDSYLGRTRVERASEFATALQKSGVSCRLQVFPGVGHEVTPTMLKQAVLFFSEDESHTTPLQ